MNYKKILRNPRTRYTILRILSWIPDGVMIRLQYFIKLGRLPKIRHPKRFTEKIQNYKLYYRNPLMHLCVDKFDVRDYVRSKGLEKILNKCYGVFSSADEIDFDKLPSSFVIKATYGGGNSNVILINNSRNIELKNLKEMIGSWFENDIYISGREWAYKGLRKRIIVEKLLEDDTNPDGTIDDYKFLCFHGKFRYLWIDKDRAIDHKRGFWNQNLDFLPNISSDHKTFDTPPALPQNINEMVKISETLSKDFPHARIDLYNIKGKIFFGEITFYSCSGYVALSPDSFDYELGSYFQTVRTQFK